MDHEEGVTCMEVYAQTNTLIAGTKDGQLLFVDADSCYTVNTLSVHHSSINACLVCGGDYIHFNPNR